MEDYAPRSNCGIGNCYSRGGSSSKSLNAGHYIKDVLEVNPVSDIPVVKVRIEIRGKDAHLTLEGCNLAL